MPTRKLTDRAVRAAKTNRDRGEDFRDSVVRGLVLRVYASGAKTWGILYRTGRGRRRWFKLGDASAIDLADARRRARVLLGKVAEGEDPQAEREASRRVGDVETVADLAECYLKRYAERHKRPRSVAEDRGQLKRYVLPAWGSRPATEIARRDVKQLLEELADGTIALRGKPTTTAPQALRAMLSKMFAWAVEEELLPANPAAGVPLPVKPKSRDRVLSEDEIRTLWRALADLEVDSPLSASAFRLILLTAQRPGEVLGLRWSEIDGGWWTIPQERHKGQISHRVPLSAQALAELERVSSLTGTARHVFDSPTRPGQPISTLKTSNRGIVLREGMERWTPHDLRRTAATMLTSGGTPRLVVERILGHAEHGVAAVYDRSSYDKEKRRALLWWGSRIERIAEGAEAETVVEFPVSA